jgi:hypothetical protein
MNKQILLILLGTIIYIGYRYFKRNSLKDLDTATYVVAALGLPIIYMVFRDKYKLFHINYYYLNRRRD